MKYIINDLIIIEGKEDESYLSSFIDGNFITTRGYTIPKEEIDYIKEVRKQHNVICLTDPDEAGNAIFEKINGLLQNISRICVDIRKCTRGVKSGIAECEKEEIIEKLKPYITQTKFISSSDIKEIDLYNLGITGGSNSKKIREFVCLKLHLGLCNSKTILKRIHYLNITFKTLEETVIKYGNQ